MQRIDEKTYIDDTLVTCAEYQLFIDEMREQGKYYQPDHWTSYYFPAGEARRPILGVRYSDTVEFCKWVTQRVVGEWAYRLPVQEEMAKRPLASIYQAPIGYWLLGAQRKGEFTWSGPLTDTNIRTLSSELFDNIKKLAITSYIEEALMRTRNQPLDLDIYNDSEYADHYRHHDPEAYIDRERKKYMNFINDPEISFANAEPLFDEKAHQQKSQQMTLSEAKKGTLDEIRYLASYSLLGHTLHQQSLEQACEFFVDILTLEERIAGRSPAFEGIRLVKERIR